MNLAKALLELGRGVVHPFAQTGTALAYTPKATYRLLQNKPIDDIQRRVFGTNDQGAIARNIIGNTAQVGLTVALPAAKGMTALQGAKYGAQVGAAGGVASGFADTGKPIDMLQRGATGGALGGLIGGATPLGRAMWLNRSKATTEGIPFVQGAPNMKPRVGPNSRYTMGDVAEYKLNKNSVDPRDWNKINQEARTLSKKYNIDLVNGSPAEINERVAQFLDRFDGM